MISKNKKRKQTTKSRLNSKLKREPELNHRDWKEIVLKRLRIFMLDEYNFFSDSDHKLTNKFAKLNNRDAGRFPKSWLLDFIASEAVKNHNRLSQPFYSTIEWRTIRKKVLSKYGCACMKCGEMKNIHIDHIKPRSKYPSLELDFDNLQVLCMLCNILKSNKDETDYREIS